MKIFRYVIITLCLHINVFAKKECSEVLSIYSLDYNTKSFKGWMRVCNNDKLNLYVTTKLTTQEKEIICNCFYYDYKDRDVTIRNKR